MRDTTTEPLLSTAAADNWLSDRHRDVLAGMVRLAGDDPVITISLANISDEVAIPLPTVQRLINTLIARAYLSKVRYPGPRRHPCTYRIGREV